MDKYQNMSEGEAYIAYYLDEEDIKYEYEKTIPKLKGDQENYRVPDFYLPRLKVYIEFFGKWNVSEEQKNRYRIKRKIYKENGIPCIYIYPENLGIFDFIFENRLIEVFHKFNMKHEYRRYQLHYFLKEFGFNLFLILACLLGIIYSFDGAMVFLMILLVIQLILGIKNYFIEDIQIHRDFSDEK